MYGCVGIIGVGYRLIKHCSAVDSATCAQAFMVYVFVC
jgi:hypothetical protein